MSNVETQIVASRFSYSGTAKRNSYPRLGLDTEVGSAMQATATRNYMPHAS